MLRGRLFGPMALSFGDREVPKISGLRPRSVLAWLLLEPGPHARAHVAARFWPDVLDMSARASLRNVLSIIRTALEAAGAGAYLAADRTSVGIAPGLPRAVDVELFAQLERAGDPRSLERAFALADAPLLSDLADDWVLELRDLYRDRTVDIALRLADAAEAAGDAACAIAWTRRALRRAPLREAVHRALMERLAAVGERAEALDAYDRLAGTLAAEFGTPPSAETRALAERLRARPDSGGPGPAQPSHATGPPQPAHTPEPERLLPADPRGPRRPPLVGRDGELATLEALWDRTRRGSGAVALVAGPPGIGKSRLAAAAREVAESSGGLCATGTALELDGAPPLGPWSDALHQLVPRVPAPPAATAWPAGLAHVCSAVETAWARHPAPHRTEPDLERLRLFEAIAAALAWCARDRPLLVVLEDLHLMDAASVALLTSIGRRVAAAPVMIVVTARERTGVAEALRRVGALDAELELAPLGDRAIDAIVEAVAPRLDVDARRRVVTAAGGVPLIARQAACAAAAGGDPAEGLADWVRGPRARLSEPGRRLVDLVAAAGRPLERGEAAQLLGAGTAQALDEACREQLLDAREDRRIGFQHALVRDACYAELAPAHRAGLHGELADMLISRSSRSTAEIARHLLLAHRDEDAAGHLEAAAAAARRLGALDEAAAFLRDAVAIAGSDELAAELWLLLADVESWRGDRAAYDEAFRRAAELLERARDPVALAAAHVAYARCLRTTLCYPRQALAAYERALELTEACAEAAPELRALALAGAAWAEAVSGDVQRAHELVALVEALPEAAQDPALAGELALDRAAALMRAGRFADSVGESDRAMTLALEAGRPELAHVACVNAAAAAAARGDPAGALALVERAQGISGRAAHPDHELAATRAYVMARLGRHDEARRAADELAMLAERSASPAAEAIAAFDRGSIALAAGDAIEAAARLEEALTGPADRVPRALARLRLAEARLGQGDVDAAAAELDRVPFEPVGPADMPDGLAARLRRLQGLVAADRGDGEQAAERLGQAAAIWRSLLAAAPSGDAFAAAFVDLGRPPVAGLLEPGVELGRVLAERALVLSRSGRLEEARRDLAEANRLAGEHGYEGYRPTLARAAETIDLEVT